MCEMCHNIPVPDDAEIVREGDFGDHGYRLAKLGEEDFVLETWSEYYPHRRSVVLTKYEKAHLLGEVMPE